MSTAEYREFIASIQRIGKVGVCSRDEMVAFIPHFLTLRGSEPLFKIGWASAKRCIDDDVAWFVKGLHMIECRYKHETGYEVGFGSPSPSFKVIKKPSASQPLLAQTLTEWIARRGGNYYINDEN